MRTVNSTNTPKMILENVENVAFVRDIWTANYPKVIPISIQSFELTSILPAIFYMFRFGHRRGKGGFAETFSDNSVKTIDGTKKVTVENVANKLAESDNFKGFEGSVAKAILSDLLLTYCLENANHKEGRREIVQRVAPTHYFASWIDLPEDIGNLRFVPETIVAMLANQNGEWVEQNKQNKERTWFPVGANFANNALIKAFNHGVNHEGYKADLNSDHFCEKTSVGLDQILIIRIAQMIGKAPKMMLGKDEKISNQRPIAEKASKRFSEDIRHFVRDYSQSIPRHSFVEMMESGISIGLSSILTSTADILFEWMETGAIKDKEKQLPISLFVDCSNGMNRNLRLLSEQTMDDFMRRMEHLPVIFMALRLLDYFVSCDSSLKKLLPTYRPYATQYLNFLGDIMMESNEASKDIIRDINRLCLNFSESIEEEYPDIVEALLDTSSQTNPVWRLAETLTALQGRGNAQNHMIQLINSVFCTDKPNGLAIKRKVTRKTSTGSKLATREVRSVVLTDATIEYLVHIIGVHGDHALSYGDFLRKIREQYGFYVDAAPPNMEISSEWLRENRTILERRLRDLGLLAGVNDAESMKFLQPRFHVNGG